MKRLKASKMISVLQSLIKEHGDHEIINHSVEYSLSLDDVQGDSMKVIYLWIYPITE
jgi:hypothetical protein